MTLSEQLRAATRDVHARAERSGVMRHVLRGRVERTPYLLLLRSLHRVYAALEQALDAHPHLPVRFPDLYRTEALALDLVTLHGADWRRALVPVPAAQGLAERIRAYDDSAAHRLAAHAYVRYLGDLSGGTVLGGIVARSLALDRPRGTAFYVFPPPAPGVWKERFRAGLDCLDAGAAARTQIVDEAVDAFRRHIDMFRELDAASTPAPD